MKHDSGDVPTHKPDNQVNQSMKGHDADATHTSDDSEHHLNESKKGLLKCMGDAASNAGCGPGQDMLSDAEEGSNGRSVDSGDFEFREVGALAEPALPDICPADELFYKGQLLPLQPHTRMRYLSQQAQAVASSSGIDREQSGIKFSSCRMDGLSMEPALVDFRCASFPSHHQVYCYHSSTGEESTSSSCDSDGSSQDSFPHTTCHQKKDSSYSNAGSCRSTCTTISCASGVKVFNNCTGTSHAIASSSFKWKSLFGLKKSSKVWVDHEQNHVASGKLSSRPSSNRLYEPQDDGDEEKQKGRMSLKWVSKQRLQSYARKLRLWNQRKNTDVMNYASPFSQEAKSGSNKEGMSISSGSQPRITRPSLERHFSHPALTPMGHMGLDASAFVSLSSSPMMLSLNSASKPDLKNAASCPASMLSSPNHSGLLSHSFIPCNMQEELHSAVQSAIAHCKQSIALRSP